MLTTILSRGAEVWRPEPGGVEGLLSFFFCPEPGAVEGLLSLFFCPEPGGVD